MQYINPLSTMEEATEVNSEIDLVSFCANCHRMVHRRKANILDLQSLKDLVRGEGISKLQKHFSAEEAQVFWRGGNMVEIISQLFSKYGISAVVFMFMLYVIKNNPITSLSSSAIEMKLATKDKRFYIKGIKDILSVIVLAVLLTIFTILTMDYGNFFSFGFLLISTIITLAIFIYIYYLDSVGKKFSDIAKEWTNIKKTFIYMLIILNFLSLFILIAIFMSKNIYPLFSISNEDKKNYIYIGLLAVYLLIAPGMYITVVGTFQRFLETKNSKYTLKIRFQDEDWYLFHPIEKEVYLLGNNSSLSECTKFAFIEKQELLKKTISIEK